MSSMAAAFFTLSVLLLKTIHSGKISGRQLVLVSNRHTSMCDFTDVLVLVYKYNSENDEHSGTGFACTKIDPVALLELSDDTKSL